MASAAHGFGGVWIYRSFHNDPEPVRRRPDGPDKLVFAEGELIVAEGVGEEFSATLSFGEGYAMDLAGTVQWGSYVHPFVIRARGMGREGTGSEGWVYDYLFYSVEIWTGSTEQREAMVGSVMRAADHGAAMRGYVASTITVRRG